MNSSEKTNRRPLVWTPVEDIEDKETGIAVRITQSDAYRPRYSVEIVRMMRTPGVPPRPARHIAAMMTSWNGKVELAPFYKTVSKLLEQAHASILARAQRREDEILQEKMDREQRDLDRGKPKMKPGLKQLAKLDREAKQRSSPGEAEGSGS